MATIAPTSDAPDMPLEQYVRAIARRNLAWVDYQDLRRAWLATGGKPGPGLRRLNSAQDAYEWAARDLISERIAFRMSRRSR